LGRPSNLLESLRDVSARTQGATTHRRAVVVPWLVSRVLATTVLLVFVPHGDGSRWVALLHRWDGAHYLDIARSGYHGVEWPFFPGYPALIRVLEPFGHLQVSVFLVNQALLLLALAGVYRLARRRGSERAATLAVWALAFFPASFVFSMSYPSALFLALSTWAFNLAEEDHCFAAGLLAAGAALTRPNGIVVAVALLFAVRTVRRRAAVSAPSVIALGAWCIYCLARTGDALVFLSQKSNWDEITLWRIVAHPHDLPTDLYPHVILATAALAVVIAQRRRLPRSWVLLSALVIVPSFALGVQGMARYANECFPPFVAAGQVLERLPRWVDWAVITLGAGAMTVFAIGVTSWRFLP
jgi:hypothetical protein